MHHLHFKQFDMLVLVIVPLRPLFAELRVSTSARGISGSFVLCTEWSSNHIYFDFSFRWRCTDENVVSLVLNVLRGSMRIVGWLMVAIVADS